MGAWYCEGEGCTATIPGAHPIEQGDEGWSQQEAMLCRACTAEAAFDTVLKRVEERLVEDASLQGARHELQRLYELLHEQRKLIDRAATFDPGA